MKIQDLFERPIDRDLKGVIKVGQEDDKNAAQELDEYVVTTELSRHFATFFKNYSAGLHGNTDKMGVWISGFFGSGKSHFLKILSYLLENKTAGGKTALSYFEDGGKIKNDTVLSEMRDAASVPTDVILFNIDAKSDSSSRNEERSMVKTFLRVFNEMQGFCGSLPYVADLERFLTEKGKYQEFKDRFEEISHSRWEDERDNLSFNTEETRKAIVAVGVMNEERAKEWVNKVDNPYDLSISDFGKLLKKYLDRKNREEGGDDHHLVFLVDEVGQYIGGNTHVMLNLQTIVEELGTVGQGKIWILVTSQQNIGDVVKNLDAVDFSKIQGRFDTRLSLSSANVDEVIRKRILKKTESARAVLEQFYEDKEIDIKNKISFNDTVEKKIYTSQENFADVYPFVTYQFNLLAHVLMAVRTHSASGKHLSEGERSMLGMFKEAAMAVKEKETGVLIPFSDFYDPMESFLDHTHRSVIIRARDNSYINPEQKDHTLAIELLKLLFLIKYVDDVKANEDNLTSLMISSVSEDRALLKDRIHKALAVLCQQNLVQKNGDVYLFLTDEEQSVNQAIENIEVDNADIRQQIGALIFDNILGKTSYTVPWAKGRYTYRFTPLVDDYYVKNAQEPIGVRIITPLSDRASNEQSLTAYSMSQERDLLIVLPETDTSLDDIQRAIRINTFLRQANKEGFAHYSEVEVAKTNERGECLDRAEQSLRESLRRARIYFRGNQMNIKEGNEETRLTEALGRFIEQIYNQRSLMDVPADEKDIESVLQGKPMESLVPGDDTIPNEAALKSVKDYMGRKGREKLSLKSLKDVYTQIPYGFLGTDVAWLAASLFKDGELALYVSGAPVTIRNTEVPLLLSYFKKRQYEQKLILEKRTRVSEADLSRAWSIFRSIWPNAKEMSGDEDLFCTHFRNLARNRIDQMKRLLGEKYQWKQYPGKSTIENGCLLFERLVALERPRDLIQAVLDKEDDLEDYVEDYGPIYSFFFNRDDNESMGRQEAIFQNALKAYKRYTVSDFYITDAAINGLASRIHSILGMPSPYGKINELKTLTETFNDQYDKLMEQEAEPVKKDIRLERDILLEELREKSYNAANAEAWNAKFRELEKSADTMQNIQDLRGLKEKAKTFRERCEQEMERLDAAEEARKAREKAAKEGGNGQPAAPVKIRRTRTLMATSALGAKREIRSDADLDRLLTELREKIKAELGHDGNTTVKIFF